VSKRRNLVKPQLHSTLYTSTLTVSSLIQARVSLIIGKGGAFSESSDAALLVRTCPKQNIVVFPAPND
jgi:hypothetical protein